jgi:hypothetical protein
MRNSLQGDLRYVGFIPGANSSCSNGSAAQTDEDVKLSTQQFSRSWRAPQRLVAVWKDSGLSSFEARPKGRSSE